MSKSNLRLISPTKVKRTVTPRLRPNSELRPREHLTEREVEKLIEAAKSNRHGARDSCMLMICFRHGLRASELCELQWTDVEFETATLHIRRAKGGTTTTHPLLGEELRALRALKRRPSHPSSLFRREAHRSPSPVCKSWLSAPATPPRSALRCTLICCGMRPGLYWRTRAPIRARCRRTSGIAAFNQQCDIPSSRPAALRTCGAKTCDRPCRPKRSRWQLTFASALRSSGLLRRSALWRRLSFRFSAPRSWRFAY